METNDLLTLSPRFRLATQTELKIQSVWRGNTDHVYATKNNGFIFEPKLPEQKIPGRK